MSLDVYLTEVKPTEVYSGNITHNLGKMADAVTLSNGLTLYQILWRPEEHNLTKASDLTELLREAWKTLQADPDKFIAFNPENNWGSYSGLCNFVRDYFVACLENPDSKVEVCR